MTLDQFADRLNKELAEERQRLSESLLSGSVGDFTQYKSAVARLDQVERLQLKVNDLYSRYVREDDDE